jgi:hypothetical protein
MGCLTPTYEDRLKREIPDAVALDPITTIPELTDSLNERPDHSFGPSYIKRLRDKVSHQLIVESDRMRIEDRMTIARKNHRIVRDELLAIPHFGALAPLHAALESADAQRLEIIGILGCAKTPQYP